MTFNIPFEVPPSQVVAGTATLLALIFWIQKHVSKPENPYPPGPRPLPVIGNVLDLPRSRYALTWGKYGELYGSLTWLEAFGQKFLVLNSMEAVTDLLEKRAANFVDRQRLTMLNEVVGLSKYLTLSKYNSLVKTQRAALKQPLSAPSIREDYSKLLEEKSREYLRRCLSRPEDFLSELHNIVGEVIIRMTYGRLKDEAGTDYVRVSERLMSIVTAGLEGYAVDLIPALKYLPSWLPGMEFKRSGLRLRKEFVEFELEMLKSVTESLHSEDPEVRASFMYKKFEELRQEQDDTMDPQQVADEEMSLIRVGIQVFVGGIETTRNTLETFILAMSLFPLVQEKAWSEIDRVIGSQRLPVMDDIPNMPYMHAVVLETLRWNPTATFAVPHVSREDEVYGGYYIPKGTAVIANAWGISQNPKYYSNPSEFNPDRHLQEPPELDPREYGFGYGRRICPGKELAFRQTWLMAVSIIWAFKLVTEEDDLEAWRARVDRYYFKVLNRPFPYRCQFIPRHEDLKEKLGASDE